MSEGKRLYRSQTERTIGGVCGGLARYLSIDPVLVRLGFVALGLVNGLGILVYMIMWLVVPDEASRDLSGEDIIQTNMTEIGQQARRFVESFKGTSKGPALGGLILISLGALFLMKELIPGLGMMLWPVLLILIGGFLLFSRR